jgi:hypothetical protein
MILCAEAIGFVRPIGSTARQIKKTRRLPAGFFLSQKALS